MTHPRVGLPEPPHDRIGTLYAALTATARSEPERVLLRDRSESVSYGALLAGVEADAGRLAGLGLGAGDRVVLWLPNGEAWARAFFACSRLGMIAVMAGTRLQAADLRHILADSDARALIWEPCWFGRDYDRMVESILAGELGPAPTGLRHLLTTRPGRVTASRTLSDLSVEPSLAPFDQDGEPAVVCYTSGSTGLPKGCLQSHRSLLRNATVAAGLTGLAPGERILCPVPFAHVFGFHMGVLQATISGATLVNAEPYEPGRLLDLAAAEAATVLYMVPAMAREAVREQRRRPRDLRSVRLTVLGGSPVSEDLRREILDENGIGSQITVVYGLTEAPTLTQLPPDAPSRLLLGSVGTSTPGVELRVCGAGTTEALPAGAVGEVLARGYNLMLGYLGDGQATAAKMRGEWLVTGDLGRLDEGGFLHFVGRADETFIVGGFNLSPAEIEVQLEEFDGLLEAAVVGVPDERLGAVPMAFVTVADPALREAEILAMVGHRMASYKRPRHIRVVPELPRTASGKIARAEVRELARSALPELDWEGASTTVEEESTRI